jgi:hypothetical protein
MKARSKLAIYVLILFAFTKGILESLFKPGQDVINLLQQIYK